MAQKNPDTFFKDYFSKNPDHTIEQAVQAFDSLEQQEEGVGTRIADAVVPPVLRVGGAIAGGVAGAAAGPLGVIGGGAAGAGLGETLAEMYEVGREKRTALNPAQILVQTGLGGVPLGKGGQLARQLIGKRAAQGAVMGASSTALTDLTEGRDVSLPAVTRSALIGGILGAGGGKLESKLRRIPQIRTNISRLDQLEEARAAAPTTSRQSFLKRFAPKAVTRKFINQFTDIDDFVTKGEKAGGFSVRPEHDPRVINDLVFGGTTGRVENAFSDFQSITEEAEKAGLKDVLNRYLDLQFMSHGAETLFEHAGQAARTGQRQAGQEILRKLGAGESLPVGYTPQALTQDVTDFRTQLGPRFGEVEALGKKVFEQNRKALDIAHKAGIVSDEVYQKLVARPDNYGPLTRIMDQVQEELQQGRAANLSLRQQRQLFNLEGSKRATQSPLESSMSRMQTSIREAGRNEAARTFVALRNLHPSFATQITPVPNGTRVPKGVGSISFYEGGQRKTFAVPEEIATAMQLAEFPEVKVMGEGLMAFFRNNLQRLATGQNLGFSIPNLGRDIGEARKLSKAFQPYNPMDLGRFSKEFASSLKSIINKDPEYRAFLDARAGYSTLQKNIDPKQFVTEGPSASPFRAAGAFNSLLEEGTKLTTFKRLKSQGKSDVQAAIETRRYGGSPDFARRGTLSPEMNLLLMFFNANVQGITRAVNRLVVEPITDPARALPRVASILGASTLTAMSLHRYNSSFVDPDGTPSMARVSRTDRKNNLIFMLNETYTTADGTERHAYRKLPKSHVAKMILNPLEDVFYGEVGKQTALDTAAGFAPFNLNIDAKRPVTSGVQSVTASLNPALKVPIEQLANLDTFRDMPIEGRKLEGLEPNLRFDGTTSPSVVKATQWLNEQLGNDYGRLSPKRVEHALKGTVAIGPGEMALTALDSVIKPPEERNLEGDEAIRKTPLLGPILGRFVGSGHDQQEADVYDDFYALAARAEEITKTAQELARQDKASAQKYLADPEIRAIRLAGPAIRKILKGLANVRKARSAPGADPKRLGEAERQLLEEAKRVQERIQQLQDPESQPPEAGEKPSDEPPITKLSKPHIDSLYEQYRRAPR